MFVLYCFDNVEELILDQKKKNDIVVFVFPCQTWYDKCAIISITWKVFQNNPSRQSWYQYFICLYTDVWHFIYKVFEWKRQHLLHTYELCFFFFIKISFDFAIFVQVLRHEEFKDGCAASCNGYKKKEIFSSIDKWFVFTSDYIYFRPYENRWSKTMIGYGSESNHFVIELTYNYGVTSYDLGKIFFYVFKDFFF